MSEIARKIAGLGIAQGSMALKMLFAASVFSLAGPAIFLLLFGSAFYLTTGLHALVCAVGINGALGLLGAARPTSAAAGLPF